MHRRETADQFVRAWRQGVRRLAAAFDVLLAGEGPAPLHGPLGTVHQCAGAEVARGQPARLVHDSEQDNQQLRELEQLMAEKKGSLK